MRDADKNRDPERARQRAKADARCALRKLGLLAGLEDIADNWSEYPADTIDSWVLRLLKALDIEVTP